MTTEELNVENILEEDAQDNPVTHEEIIETVIASLEQNNSAMVMHEDDGHLWKFQYGSAEIFVQLTGETDEDLLTVWSTVLDLPARNEPELMRHLLEMNWSGTFETCFGIFNNQVVVLTQRTVAELSPGEISRAVTLVATIADDNDEILAEKFGQLS
ncbi:YbjN domain-containing protein [Gloeocapsa sp. PCC 73106]|uniref:YbjN domain-containing protein n=1 Tax=Gloeocapsa sp. PCC 73106 TaxID=102232 RepID=UPI0002AC8E67|nr:YbjN domain-containing protein [Gloeocapsa sp. PCC 73106]ELR99177.1 protein of unknown function (DUF1821) [Gloeocapsa sp. PCC 73106]